MTWYFGVVLAALGALLLWGVFAPRNQWWVLTSWSVSDPHRYEPGATAYGIRRVLSALGTLGIAVVLAVTTATTLANRPAPFRPSAVQQMWGTPVPLIVERVVIGLPQPPAGLVATPVLGYQSTSPSHPAYLTGLTAFELLGTRDIPGLIGTTPASGLPASDIAAVVVKVAGALGCIPRAAVVIETAETVQIAVYYGLPDTKAGAAVDLAIACPADAPVTTPLLVPITLKSSIGKRAVQDLSGTPIPQVLVRTATN